MKLHSNIIGNGNTPLLILHGLFGMGDNWKTLARRFADEHDLQVHLIDQRNHGRSPHADEWTYEVMSNDLKEYCNTHDLEQVVLLGHSMGGKTAMYFASQYPEFLKALIVVDIAPKTYPPHHEQILAGLSALYGRELTSRAAAEEELSHYVDSLGVRQFLLKNLYWQEKGKLAFRMNFPVIRDHYDLVTQALPEETRYDGPVLFIKGQESGYISDTDGELLKRHFPKSQLIAIKQAGHWVHAEKPDEFYKSVTGFLAHHKII